jgi:hypothetical protein
MSKGPKAMATSAHAIAMCSSLIVEHIDIVMNEESAKELKQHFAIVQHFCESISSSVFNVEEIYSSTYIQEVTNQLNTVIRKNATFIK